MVFLMTVLAPIFLPLLHLVTLATLPLTALYALAGLLFSPVLIPLLILKKLAILTLSIPALLVATPLAVPVGFFLAAACITKQAICSFIFVLTPLLWPVYFLMKWCRYTCIVASVMVTDTVMPWLVPIRFTILAALLPKLLLM